MSNTELKIGVGIDQQGSRAVDNMFKSMMENMSRLTKRMEEFGATMERISSGSGGGKKKGATITDAMFGDTSALAKKGNQVKATFQEAANQVTSFVTVTEQQFKRLEQISAKGFTFGGFNGRGGGPTSFTPGGGGGGGSGLPPSGPGGAQYPITGKRGGEGGAYYPISGGGGGGASPPKAPADNNRGSASFMGGLQQIAGGNVMGGIGSIISSPAGRLGAYGGAAYAGFKIADSLYNNTSDLYTKQVDYVLNNKLNERQGIAAAGSPFRNIFGASISKDMAGLTAWKKVFSTKEYMDSARNISLNQEQVRALAGELTSSPLTAAAGKKIAGWGQSLFEVTGEDLLLQVSQYPNAQELLEKRLLQKMPGEAVERLNAAQHVEHQNQSPFFNMLGNDVAQNWQNRYWSAAAGGRRTGIYKDKKTGQTYDRYLKDEEDIMRSNMTREQSNQGYQSALQIGQGYTKYGNEFFKVGMAGFTNATDLVKKAGILTGSTTEGYNYFHTTGQGTVGRGGLDVAVGKNMLDMLAERAFNGAASNSAQLDLNARGFGNLIKTFSAGGGTGGQDMANYMLTGGLDKWKEVTSGSRSPFDQVMSWQSAIKASSGGKYGLDSQLYQGMDPMQLRAISFGVIPEELKGVVTPEGAKSFLEGRHATQIASFVPGLLKNNPALTPIYEAITAHGGQRGAALETLASGSGLTGNQLIKEKIKIARQMALFEPEVRGSYSAKTAGFAAGQILMENLNWGSIDGGRVGLPGLGLNEKIAKEKEIALKRQLAKEGGDPNITKGLRSVDYAGSAKIGDSAVSSLSEAANDAGQALSVAAGYLKKFGAAQASKEAKDIANNKPSIPVKGTAPEKDKGEASRKNLSDKEALRGNKGAVRER